MMTDRERRRELADEARHRLVSALDAQLGDSLTPTPGERNDIYADGVVVDTFGVLERCPRRAANPADDYVDSVATARRRVGLLVLRRMGDDASGARTVADAVDEVMDDGSGWPQSLWTWTRELDRAGRAAVAAGTVTWCVGLLRVVGAPERIRWADPVQAPRWNVPDRLVAIKASMEASFGGVVNGERLLVVSDGVGGAGDRLRAGHLALVRALSSSHAPVRVALAAPSRGSLESVAVDEDLLGLAVDRATEYVVHRADPPSAPAVPGRWCRHCHLLDRCDEGTAEVGGG